MKYSYPLAAKWIRDAILNQLTRKTKSRRIVYLHTFRSCISHKKT